MPRFLHLHFFLHLHLHLHLRLALQVLHHLPPKTKHIKVSYLHLFLESQVKTTNLAARKFMLIVFRVLIVFKTLFSQSVLRVLNVFKTLSDTLWN